MPNQTDTLLQELAEICQHAGRSLLLVQGGGGNGSVKSPDADRMWIKASGYRMAEVTPESGYVEVGLSATNAITRDPELASIPTTEAHEIAVGRTNALASGSRRPSMETGFHALLGPVVLHTHAAYVNAFACMEGGKEALASATDRPFLWIEYETPGYVLGTRMDREIAEYMAEHGVPPSAIILASHGFIASADTAAEAIAITTAFEEVGKAYFGAADPAAVDEIEPSEAANQWAADLKAALAAQGKTHTARAARLKAIQEAAFSTEVLIDAPLIPDDVIYSGDTIYRAGEESAESWLKATFETIPDKFVVVLPGKGVVLAGPEKTVVAIEENLLAHVLVRTLIARRGKAVAMAKSEVAYLQSMESEKYRQAVAAGNGGK